MSANARRTHGEGEDGSDNAALVVPAELGEDRLEHRGQLGDQALPHVVQRAIDQVINLGVVLVLQEQDDMASERQRCIRGMTMDRGPEREVLCPPEVWRADPEPLHQDRVLNGCPHVISLRK